MILVTVGMHTDGFSRLVKEMDRIAATIDEEVVIQIGATPYRPSAASWFNYATQEEMDVLCQQARVIVSHAGAGTILTALRHAKPLIVVPRRQEYHEHVDDHQFELAKALSQIGVICMANGQGDLETMLDAAGEFTPPAPNRQPLIQALRREIVGHIGKSREACAPA